MQGDKEVFPQIYKIREGEGPKENNVVELWKFSLKIGAGGKGLYLMTGSGLNLFFRLSIILKSGLPYYLVYLLKSSTKITFLCVCLFYVPWGFEVLCKHYYWTKPFVLPCYQFRFNYLPF